MAWLAAIEDSCRAAIKKEEGACYNSYDNYNVRHRDSMGTSRSVVISMRQNHSAAAQNLGGRRARPWWGDFH